jgi:hypothetical protein
MLANRKCAIPECGSTLGVIDRTVGRAKAEKCSFSAKRVYSELVLKILSRQCYLFFASTSWFNQWRYWFNQLVYLTQKWKKKSQVVELKQYCLPKTLFFTYHIGQKISNIKHLCQNFQNFYKCYMFKNKCWKCHSTIIKWFSSGLISSGFDILERVRKYLCQNFYKGFMFKKNVENVILLLLNDLAVA